MTTSPRAVARIHFHVADPPPGLYDQLLAVLETVTPRIEAHRADWSADLDLTGALRYWARDPAALVDVIRLRILALHGVQTSAGTGPNRTIATMAAAVSPPGTATVIGPTPYDTAQFLRPRPAAALPGIGPASAKSLTRYGIHTIGDIADTPLLTLQRILGFCRPNRPCTSSPSTRATARPATSKPPSTAPEPATDPALPAAQPHTAAHTTDPSSIHTDG